MSFISLQNITKTYENADLDPVQILKGVNLEINQGDFFAIMGASGSGKSTLMNIVGLLDTPTSGIYNLDGKAVQDLSENEQSLIRRNTIGFVFQWYNLLKKLKAWQQVALPLSYLWVSTEEKYQRAVKALEIVGLGDKIDNGPSQLSGGQQQRVCIARALVTNSKLILADEPTGALDSKTGQGVMELFQQLHVEQGKTLLLITHDPKIAQIANKAIKMQDGIFVS